MKSLLKRLPRLYSTLAVLLLNTVVLLLLVELVAVVLTTLNPPATTQAETVEEFKQRMLRLSYYYTQDWAREYWDEHMEVVDHWAYRPYTIWRTLPYNGTQINVGEDGIRPTPDSNCGTDTYRVYVFGGSTTWGYGVPDWGTISAYMQDRMETRDVCVVNQGELAFNSTQELIWLIQLIESGDIPDLVIFYDGTNDVSTAGRSSTPGSHFFIENIRPVVKGSLVQDAADAPTNLLFELISQTALCRLLSCSPEPAEPDWAYAPFEPAFVDAIVDIYLKNIRIAELLGVEYGFEFYAFVQPVLPVVNRDYTEEEQVLMWNTPGNIADLFYEVYPRLASAAETDEQLFYFGNILDEQPYPIWIDFHHLTPWGNLAIAHEITEIILPVIDTALETRT